MHQCTVIQHSASMKAHFNLPHGFKRNFQRRYIKQAMVVQAGTTNFDVRRIFIKICAKLQAILKIDNVCKNSLLFCIKAIII